MSLSYDRFHMLHVKLYVIFFFPYSYSPPPLHLRGAGVFTDTGLLSLFINRELTV